MTEHPILFSAPMIRAILDGRKTVTRRIVKLDDGRRVRRSHRRWHPADPNAVLGCPYGQAGDTLWVRETFSGPDCMEATRYSPAAPPSKWGRGARIWYWADGNPPSVDWTRPRPSIHMPRWASRITLRITDVRVERLQQITEADAMAEGVPNSMNLSDGRSARGNFEHLWWQIHGDDAWEADPWVWVISFERVEPKP